MNIVPSSLLYPSEIGSRLKLSCILIGVSFFLIGCRFLSQASDVPSWKISVPGQQAENYPPGFQAISAWEALESFGAKAVFKAVEHGSIEYPF